MLRKWKVTFKTLSPVHIKGQEPGYGSGIVPLGRTGYVIDEIKLGKFLQEKGIIEEYVDYVNRCLQDREEPSLKRFFQQDSQLRKQLNDSTLKSISSRITTVGDGNTFICDGNGKYFMPGSSIKGAIRTALLYHILDNLQTSNQAQFNNLVINTINQKLTDYRRARARGWRREMEDIKKSFDDEIVERELQSFLDNLVRSGKVKTGPHTDVLRTLKVADAPITAVNQETIKVVCLQSGGTFYFGPSRRPISLNYDCLKEEIQFTTEILLDLGLLSEFYPGGGMPFSDIGSLFNIIKKFGERQWTEERKTFQDTKGLQNITNFYNPNISQPLLRVGWGTGMLGTTIDLLIGSGLREQIRNEVMGANRPGLPAPHSKRMVMRNNQPAFPLGWIEVKDFKEV